MRRIKEAGKGRVGVTGAASVGDAYAAKTDSAFNPMDLNTIAFTADLLLCIIILPHIVPPPFLLDSRAGDFDNALMA